LSTGGNPYKLTKVSTSVFDLQNVAGFDAALGDIDIQAGTLLFNGLTPNMGDPSHTLTVETGATLAFGADAVTWNKQFVFNGDGSTINLNNEGGANCVLNGPVQLNGDCVFNVGGTQLGITGGITGGGGLIKSGSSLLIFSGTNTYTGDTTINGGTLQLTNGASLSTSSNITLATGASLDTQGVGLTLASGHSLNGNGTVLNSSLTAGVGSTVSPGVGGVGKLTVNGAVTLAGTTAIELDPANNTNDVLNSTSTIAYGGTLSLANLSALSGGNSFKIFNATSYSGTFANLSPATPGPGQTWDTSALRTTGTIKVASATAPRLTSISVSGTTLNISATNGTAGAPVVLLGTTNINLPLNQWTHILTNSYNGGGGLNLSTNIINPAVHQEFYILSQ
jgi:autotransporter-associated beta strand protein